MPADHARVSFPRLLVLQCEKLALGGKEKGAVSGDWRGINRILHVDRGDQLLFTTGRENGKDAALVADVDFSVIQKRTAPDMASVSWFQSSRRQ